MVNKIIKTMRKMANYNQNELAKKCNIAASTLSGYETGYREPTFEILNTIAIECGFEIQFKSIENGILTPNNINRKEL